LVRIGTFLSRSARLAGGLADGAVTTWTSAQAIATHIAPRVTEAPVAAGRPAPRVAAIVMAAVTGHPERVRQGVAQQAGAASSLPSYRALLDRQGLGGVHETVLAGDEDTVAAGIRSYADAGANDVLVSILGDDEQFSRTLDVLTGFRRAD
jgi:alkanesulfonate monooxygenase SsuD/methylene tetrahydromethanopterin reductase-like flavin-dependent oxidoreductase (luciferase family)